MGFWIGGEEGDRPETQISLYVSALSLLEVRPSVSNKSVKKDLSNAAKN